MGVWIVDEIIQSAEKTIAEPIKLSNLTPTMKCWFPNIEDTPLKYLAEHIHRVNEADIEKPILLLKPYRIIDGYHRYLKALLENDETIKGKVLEKNDLPNPLKIISMPSFYKLTASPPTRHSSPAPFPGTISRWESLVCWVV